MVVMMVTTVVVPLIVLLVAVFVGEHVREQMTQPTEAHCEDGSELGPLGVSISGDNCHRSPLHLAD